MKQLSIEEKAKRYDEAIEKLRDFYRDYDTVSRLIDVKEELANLIPELKESEDEQSKKWILEYLYDGLRKSDEQFKGQFKAAIAWLEKQGEQKPADKVEPKFHKGDVIEVKPMKCHGKIFTGKPNKIVDITEKCYIFDDGKAYSIELQDGWELSEQKPKDKVKQKFKAGDWIIFAENHNSVYQVERIDNYRYYLRHYLGGTLSVHFDNELIRLWTIQDAKDGDVLVDEGNNIGIYKEIEGLCWHSYIYLGCDNHLYGFSIGGSHMQLHSKPATKEQCDNLFAKMKEAGYEWDIEKKELKKIVTPIFSIGDTIAEKNNSDIHDFGSFTITDITGGKYWYNDRIICDITEQDNWELYEPVRQKPAWSEEDEKMFVNIKSALQNANKDYSREIGWFHLLRLQKQWRPSEKQINALSDVLSSRYIKYDVLSELWKDLKKLMEE